MQALPDLSKSEQNRMCLSRETLEGLRMTGKCECSLLLLVLSGNNIFYFCHIVKSITEMVPYLLDVPGVSYVLTERFNQDPLESFFGKQRMRGGYNNNHNVKTFLKKYPVPAGTRICSPKTHARQL